MTNLYHCKCGRYFTGKAQLKEHIALHNHYSTDYDTMHCEVVDMEKGLMLLEVDSPEQIHETFRRIFGE